MNVMENTQGKFGFDGVAEGIETPYDNIPVELQNTPQWCNFKLKPRSKDGNSKPPVSPNGNDINVHNSANWLTFDAAVAASSQPFIDGIGFLPTLNDPYCFIDLDHCIEGGKPTPYALDIVTRLHSYTEVSPSGEGIRVVVKADVPNIHTDQLEMYCHKQYLTLTGVPLDGFGSSNVEDRQAEAMEIYNRAQAKTVTTAIANSSAKAAQPLTDAQPSGLPKVSCSYREGAKMPSEVRKLFGKHEKLPDYWAMKGDTGNNDTSPSMYGFLLLGQLALRGVSDQGLMDTLIDFRERHRHIGREHRPAWFNRQVAVARRFANDNQTAQRQRTSVSNPAFDHWQQHISADSLSRFDLAILCAIQQVSDGEDARISNNDIAYLIGAEIRHTKRRLAVLRKKDCLKVIDQPNRWQATKYRMNFQHLAIGFEGTHRSPLRGG